MAIAGTLVSHAEHLVFRGLGRFAVDSGRFPLVRRPARSPLFYIALCSLWLGASSPGRFPVDGQELATAVLYPECRRIDGSLATRLALNTAGSTVAD